MEIRVLRDKLTDKSTTGKLYINGSYYCQTLEDKTRDKKVYGETCIPTGKYRVFMHWWTKRPGWYPVLRKVPEFSGILIHKGNTAKDTLGCILVGMKRGQDSVYNCAPAFDPLKEKIMSAILVGEEVWITVGLGEDVVDERTNTA